MKFIHAADIHLDSPLSGLAAYRYAPDFMISPGIPVYLQMG